MSKKQFFSVGAAVLVGFSVVFPAAASELFSNEPRVLVVPNKYSVVQFAFDIARMRNIFLVCFSEAGVKKGESLYVWDGAVSSWVKISFEDYKAGAVFKVAPKAVILLGTERDVPAVLGETKAWCPDVTRISSLKYVDMINQLNDVVSFTAPEWKWLAKEYELKLEDLNWERRRYGKYGKPGEEKNVPMPKIEEPAPVAPAPVNPELKAVKPGVEPPMAQPVEKAPKRPAPVSPEDK